MPTVDLAGTPWRKSSYSGGDGANGNCVELACAAHAVAVRDSKAPDAGVLAVSTATWHAFESRL